MKRAGIIIISLTFLYLLLRLPNLLKIPYFGDEAEYMWYSYTALHNASERFISLQVGKQPLFIWITMLFIKIFKDPLLAGRLVSVSAGLMTMFAVGMVSYEIFKRKNIAYITCIFFIFYLFAYVHNRLGNFDSTVAMFYGWSLYLTVFLARRLRLVNAYNLSFVIAGGILTKTNAFFSLYLLPLGLFFIDYSKKWHKKVALYCIYAIVVVIIANLFYLLLQLSPYYERIDWFNGVVYPKREWVTLPISFRLHLFTHNIISMTQILFSYITFSYILLLLPPLFIKEKRKEVTFLVFYFLLPIIALAVFSRGIAARWIFLFTLPLLPLIAYGFTVVIAWFGKFTANKNLAIVNTIIFLTVIGYPFYQIELVSNEPVKANIPSYDKYYYYIDTYWGLKSIMEPIRQEAKHTNVFIGSPGLVGLVNGIKLYSLDMPSIKSKGYLVDSNTYPPALLSYAKNMPTYYLVYNPKGKTIKTDRHVSLLKTYSHKYSAVSVYLYKITY